MAIISGKPVAVRAEPQISPPCFTHGANLRQMRRLPPLPLMQNYGKIGPTSWGKANVAFADGLLQICYRGKSVFSSSEWCEGKPRLFMTFIMLYGKVCLEITKLTRLPLHCAWAERYWVRLPAAVWKNEPRIFFQITSLIRLKVPASSACNRKSQGRLKTGLGREGEKLHTYITPCKRL